MIALVEGAASEDSNEIALSILLAGLTIIFMLVCVSLYPFALYGALPFAAVLVALLVCLIPTLSVDCFRNRIAAWIAWCSINVSPCRAARRGRRRRRYAAAR